MLKVLKQIGFVPRSVTWELTLACDLRCRHCGSRAGKSRQFEMPTERALRLCDEFAELGVKKVTLGGGEPTLRNDWGMIAAKLSSLGLSVHLISNGHGWNKKLAHQAKAFGLSSVAFSLDGLEKTHEYIRRVPGHFKRIMAAFESCRSVGILFSSITTIFKNNAHELESIRDLLIEQGASSWQLQIGNPTGNLDDNRELAVQPEDLIEIVPLVARLRRETKKPRVFAGDNIGYYGDLEKDLRDQESLVPFWIGCRAGCQVVGIESNGNVKGCLSLPSAMNNVEGFIEGNLMDSTLSQIWNAPDAFSYNRGFHVEKLTGFCRQCDYADICRGGCSWTSFAHAKGQHDNPFCYHRQLQLRKSGS